MILKNIEVHNIVEFRALKNREGLEMLRVPQIVREKLYFGEQAERMSAGYTGVEFRFVMKSDVVKLRLQKKYLEDNRCNHVLHNMHIYYGGIQGAWSDHSRFLEKDTFEIVIEKPKNMDTLKEMAKLANDVWDPEVVRVILDGGYYMLLDVIGEVEPPKKEQMPQKTLLTYGSSITHGSNALDQSHTWAALLARDLQMDLRNLGMAGACAMEPEMIDFLARMGENDEWHTAILELGVNVANFDNDFIIERVTNTLKQIAGRNLDKKVYIISPFYFYDDFYEGGNGKRWRTLISEIVQKLAYPNVEYINGLDCLGNITYLCADEVHPNIYGVQKIYEQLKRKMIK